MVNKHGHMVIVSPLDGVVGPLANGRTLWLINGGDPITTYIHWDDPPSTPNLHPTKEDLGRSF